MAKLTIYGIDEETVEFEGAVYDEFYLGADKTWSGNIKAPNGDVVTVRASFGVDNPNGWSVRVVGATLSGIPWAYRKETRFNDLEESTEDQYIIIDVPSNVTVEALSG